MKYLLFVVSILLSGCNNNSKQQAGSLLESEIPPVIEFVAKTDMKKWDKLAKDVRWGIAISDLDITTVVKDDWLYNEPVFDIPVYSKYIVKKEIKSFQKVSFSVAAGVYDWLILLDLDNNGSWDSYLGSAEEHIKLNQIEFKNGFIYSVVVGEDSIPKLKISARSW